MEIRFKDKDHELNYLSLFQQMKKQTPPHQAVAYLLALDPICFLHCRELYDFREGHTIPRGLDEAWHTLISRRTTRLAFNLYNSFCSDRFENDMPSVSFTPVELFCSEYAEYYVEALRIRFPESPEESRIS